MIAARVPPAMAFFVLINGLGAALEYHYFRQRTPVLLPAFLTEVVVCLIASCSVRRAPRRALSVAIVSTSLLLLCLATYFALAGSPRVDYLFTSALVLFGVVVFYPWGWRWQLCAGISSFLGYTLVASGGAPAVLPLPFAYFTLGVCTAVTCVGAGILERQRLAMYRVAAALKASEAEFRDIFQNLQEIFFRTDLQGTIRLISPSVERYGYQVSELIGHSVLEFYGEDPSRRDEGMKILLETGALKDFEFTMRAKDGTRVPASVTARLLVDDQGQGTGLEGILRDITDRKRAEEARRQLEQQRLDFLAMVTHDLKQPITAILGNVTLLRETAGLTTEVEDSLHPIERNSRWLLELVNNYLELSRIEAGAVRLSKGVVALDEVLARVCADHEEPARWRSIHLEVDYSSDGVAAVSGDRLALERVFTNLLSNAVKFTPDDGQITIRVGQDGAHAVVAVSDTGPGISAEDLPLLFTRYCQAAHGRSVGGTGMGLFIVKSLVEAHGGSVSVDSTVGRGATFTVRLPRSEQPS